MAIFKLKLIDKKKVANHTIKFCFEKPLGFQFKPGQYGGFTLLNPPPNINMNGITRRFSLLNPPEDPYIAIATRMQPSGFKNALNELPLGDEIKFAGPTGTFTLHEDEEIPAVFIAGGIGIVPFFCMIRDTLAHHSSRPLFLFYGNQTINDAAFFDELTELAKHSPSFKLIASFVSVANDWQGETGFITHTMIKKYIADIFLPIYYVCGSPSMVTTLQETLAEMGINEDKIKVEDFPGY